MCCPLKNAAYTNLWLSTFNSQWHMHIVFFFAVSDASSSDSICTMHIMILNISNGFRVARISWRNHIRQLIVVYQKRLSLQQFHSIQPTIAYYTLTNQIHNTNVRNLTIYCFSGVILNSFKKQDSTILYSISCMP